MSAFKKCILLTFLCLGLVFLSKPVYAEMYFSVDGYHIYNVINSGNGHDNGKVRTTLTGKGDKVRFVSYFSDTNNAYVRLESENGQQKFFTFPVAPGATLTVTKINGYDPNRSFWFVRTSHPYTRRVEGINFASTQVDGIWLIGNYYGRYLPFVTKDSLAKNGVYISPGKAVDIMGEGPSPYVTLRIMNVLGKKSVTTHWVGLNWNNAANWFSITILK